MAAPVIATSTTAENLSGPSITLTKPAGTTSGELLVALFWSAKSNADPTQTVPPGFSAPVGATQLITGYGPFHQLLTFFLKPAGSSEPTSYSFGSDGEYGAGLLLRITGAAASAADAASAKLTADASAQWPSVTTTGANDLILLGGMEVSGAQASSSQWAKSGPTGTAIAAALVDDANQIYLGVAAKTATSAGATGTFSVSQPSSGSGDLFQAITLALKPSSGGGTTPAAPPVTFAYWF